MFSHVSRAEKQTEDMEGLHECCLEIRGVAIGWKECDTNQKQETYPGGRLERGELVRAPR